MNKIGKWLKQQFAETKLLLRSIPSVVVVGFVIALVAMNLLANKSIELGSWSYMSNGEQWIALDCAIIVSWLAFLCMDIITKRFGPKAATIITIVAMLCNLLMAGLLALGSAFNGSWGAYYDLGMIDSVNDGLNLTMRGTPFVLFGSTVAFLVSGIINIFANYGVGKLFKKNPDGMGAYICRSYVSTLLGQFIDNLLFAFIVSHTLFGWSVLQCVMCSLAGCVVELICEAIFSPLGYMICKKWNKEGVGNEYLNFVQVNTADPIR